MNKLYVGIDYANGKDYSAIINVKRKIGFSLIPFKMYGQWKWFFYRYAEVTIYK